MKVEECLTDPRVTRNKKYSLESIVSLVLCASTCGARSYKQVSEFIHLNQDSLKIALNIESEFPSVVTIWRNFERLNSHELLQFINSKFNFLKQSTNDFEFKKVAVVDNQHKIKHTDSKLEVLISHVDETFVHIVQRKENVNDTTNMHSLEKAIDSFNVSNNIISVSSKCIKHNIVSKILGNKCEYLIEIPPSLAYLHEQIKDQLSRYITQVNEHKTWDLFNHKHFRAHQLPQQIKWIEGITDWTEANNIIAVEYKQIEKEDRKKVKFYLSNRIGFDNESIYKLTELHFENHNQWVVSTQKKQLYKHFDLRRIFKTNFRFIFDKISLKT